MREKVRERGARNRLQELVTTAQEGGSPEELRDEFERTLLLLQEGWEPEEQWQLPEKIVASKVVDCDGLHLLPATPGLPLSTDQIRRIYEAAEGAYNRERQAKDRDGLTYAEGLADGAAEERSRWLSTDAGGDWPDGWAPRHLWERQSETIQLRLDQLRESETAYKSLQEHKDALALECAVLRKKTAKLERRLMNDEPTEDEHAAVLSDLSVIAAVLHAGTVADEHGEDDLSVCLDLLHMLWGVGGAASVRKLLERAVDRMIGVLNETTGADGVTLRAKVEPSNLQPGSGLGWDGPGFPRRKESPMPEKQAFHLMSCTNSDIPELAQVAEFYNDALFAALTSVAQRPDPGAPFLWDSDEMCRFAESLARRATERRFGIRLILPGETE